MECEFRQAVTSDLDAIKNFTDWWLAGRGMKTKAPGAVNDYFVSPSQHLKYITKYKTYIMLELKRLVAWAVIQHDGSLIHFLVAGDCRGQGLGTAMLKRISPDRIHSKSNQSTGNPASFYTSHGYKFIKSVQSKSRLDIDSIKPNREKIIDIYEKVE